MIIYKVTNLQNGKIYIGQTINSLDYRRSQHEKDCRRNKYYNNYFHNALIKYGFDSFKWEILEECDDIETLNDLEIKYIQEYESYNKEIGYNLKLGGQNGGKCCEETNRKIGETSLKKWQDPEIAMKMLEGLRKGTETVKERAKLNFIERVCPTCNTIFRVKPHSKKKYCCNKCASADPLVYKKGMEAAKEKQHQNILKQDSENIIKIKEWVHEHQEYFINIKFNHLNFLSELLEVLNFKDIRSVSRILGCKGRKELVKKINRN